MSKLLNVINQRLKKDFKNEDYLGFNMSGYGFGDDERNFLARDRCRINNWTILIDNFRDYLPDMTSDKFKLWCWKGSVWWGGEGDYDEKEKDFSGVTTAYIINWLILKKIEGEI